MRVVVVGGTGTLGSAVVAELSPRHEVVTVGHTRGEVTVDITDAAAIESMYDAVGSFDALVSAAGSAFFGPFAELTDETCQVGLRSKLMGQVNLVLLGRDRVADGGSFTLTSGILSHDPVPGAVGLSMVNGAIDSFVTAAAIELDRGVRINSVSSGLVEESVDRYGPYFPGHVPVPVALTARAYAKSVEGRLTGRVIRVRS